VGERAWLYLIATAMTLTGVSALLLGLHALVDGQFGWAIVFGGHAALAYGISRDAIRDIVRWSDR
jgi:hypothetical protein